MPILKRGHSSDKGKMEKPNATMLGDRGVLRISGEDRASFLQGLVSNDVMKADGSKAVWAALLTPQGKFLYDFFLIERANAFLLETEAPRLPELMKHLSRYKLRAKVTLEDVSEAWHVAVVWGSGALEKLGLTPEPGACVPCAEGVAYTDPRLAGLGARLLLPREAAGDLLQSRFAIADPAEHEELRISLGVPDGSRDMEVSRAILLENGFDELGGVDWNKGCFVGQELTARTKYRALIKKRLLPVVFDGEAPGAGVPVLQEDREVGVLRSTAGNRALALLRLEAIRAPAPLEAGGKPLRVEPPSWIDIQ
jgi:folate-binding protein YgfZ